MAHPLHLLLCLVEESRHGPRVLHMAVALKLYTNLDGLVAPQVTAHVPRNQACREQGARAESERDGRNVPVLRALESATVEVL